MAALAVVWFLTPMQGANAQLGGGLGTPGVIAINSTNAVAHNSTNVSSATDVSQSYSRGAGLNLGIQLKFQFTAAGASNIILNLDKSVDGASWDAAALLNWPVAGNGTNVITVVTNVVLNGIPAIRASLFNTNQGTFDLTNASIRYYVK